MDEEKEDIKLTDSRVVAKPIRELRKTESRGGKE